LSEELQAYLSIFLLSLGVLFQIGMIKFAKWHLKYLDKKLTPEWKKG